MPSLKDLRLRIRSVRSTQKITAAMKVVAASRLRRAQEQAEAARPYAQRMERVLASLAARMTGLPNAPPLLVGTGRDETHLVVVATSDRGLAGGFNATILREARRRIRDIAERILVLFRAGGFDACSIVYNRFRSAITQIVTVQQLIPFPPPAEAKPEAPSAAVSGVYEFEPSEEEILGELLPQNLAVQIYTALLENAASEQGARMTAMDNATRNAGEMIDRLNMTYNRSRQAAITKELIEIISGAEAL